MDCAPHRLQKHFYLLANISQSMIYFDQWLHRANYEVGLSSRCSLASLEPAWMPQTCIWRAM